MKRFFSILLVFTLLLSLLVLFTGCSQSEIGSKGKLYVYNWGEYIADGSYDSLRLIAIFEALTGYDVIYETFDSNETMFAMMDSGSSTYDIVIPSDYMIQKLINHVDDAGNSAPMIQPIDVSKIPNYVHIDPAYLNAYYDNEYDEVTGEKLTYSIPYNVGMVGIVYNTKYVSEEDVAEQSIDLLWNEKYAGNILTFDNARDGFGMAMVKLGLDFNTSKKEDWDAAYEELVKQKKVLQGYTMDGIYSKMEGENAYIGTYYAGDCLSMIDESITGEDEEPFLAFYYPKEGTNIFVDAMCIPTSAQNVEGAYEFINFMLDVTYREEFETSIAVDNALYLYYASPNQAVVNDPDYIDAMGDHYATLYSYPEAYKNKDGTLNTGIVQYYHDLSNVMLTVDGIETKQSVLEYMTELWIKLKLE